MPLIGYTARACHAKELIAKLNAIVFRKRSVADYRVICRI